MRRRLPTLMALIMLASLVLAGPALLAPDADAARPETSVREDVVQLERGRDDAGGAPDDGHDDHGQAHAQMAASDFVAATAPMDAGDAVMVGARWTDDSVAEVRTRNGSTWSDWMRLHRDTEEHLPDPDSAERQSVDLDASEPIWTGPIDAVQFRSTRDGELGVSFVDSSGGQGIAWAPDAAAAGVAHAAPKILRRADWGADESLRDGRISYSSTGRVRFSVLHHEGASSRWTDSEIANGCQKADDKINAIYEYHTQVRGYWDIAYNFVVDPCGRIWEARAGGIKNPVNGAHAGGFNDGSVGVLALGTFSGSNPDPVTSKMKRGLERIIGYKFDIDRVHPARETDEVSGGGSARWPSGTEVTLPVLSAHQISNTTACPGWSLMDDLFHGSGASAEPRTRYIRNVRNIAMCAGGVFTDIFKSYQFCPAISWGHANGIVSGFNDRTFRPTNGVTRQAAVAFAHRMAGSPSGPFPDPGFTDVDKSHQFYTEIAWAAHNGITKGYDDGSFRPKRVVDRMQDVAILHRLSGAPSGPFPDPGFTDVDKSHQFYTEIAWAAHNGVASGFRDGSFGPGRKVTRAEGIAFRHRLATG